MYMNSTNQPDKFKLKMIEPFYDETCRIFYEYFKGKYDIQRFEYYINRSFFDSTEDYVLFGETFKVPAHPEKIYGLSNFRPLRALRPENV